MARNTKELLERVYSLLPRTYRTADIDTRYQLKRFLEVLVEGGIFPTYDETRGLMTLIDFDRVPAKFLPDLASALGFEFPYDLDEQTQRTYIKNAVISYKIKGTETALLFMLRELTRFKTWLEVDKVNRHLDIYMEVDMGRQGFDKVVEKVDFLLKEFAPPMKSYQLINVFVWFEDFFKQMSDRHDSVIVRLPANPNNLEKYDINGITSQYGYDIMKKDEGDEHKTQVTIEEMLTFILTLQDTETSKLSVKEIENPTVIQPRYDNEMTFLNISSQLMTASNGEFYSKTKITDDYSEKITQV